MVSLNIKIKVLVMVTPELKVKLLFKVAIELAKSAVSGCLCPIDKCGCHDYSEPRPESGGAVMVTLEMKVEVLVTVTLQLKVGALVTVTLELKLWALDTVKIEMKVDIQFRVALGLKEVALVG